MNKKALNISEQNLWKLFGGLVKIYKFICSLRYLSVLFEYFNNLSPNSHVQHIFIGNVLKGDTFDRLSLTIHTHTLVILVLLFDFCIYNCIHASTCKL